MSPMPRAIRPSMPTPRSSKKCGMRPEAWCTWSARSGRAACRGRTRDCGTRDRSRSKSCETTGEVQAEEEGPGEAGRIDGFPRRNEGRCEEVDLRARSYCGRVSRPAHDGDLGAWPLQRRPRDGEVRSDELPVALRRRRDQGEEP